MKLTRRIRIATGWAFPSLRTARTRSPPPRTGRRWFRRVLRRKVARRLQR